MDTLLFFVYHFSVLWHLESKYNHKQCQTIRLTQQCPHRNTTASEVFIEPHTVLSIEPAERRTNNSSVSCELSRGEDVGSVCCCHFFVYGCLVSMINFFLVAVVFCCAFSVMPAPSLRFAYISHYPRKLCAIN